MDSLLAKLDSAAGDGGQLGCRPRSIAVAKVVNRLAFCSLSPAKPGVADRMRWAIGHVTVSASKATNGDRKLSFSSTRSRGYQAAAFVLLWSPTTKVFAGNDEVQVHDYLAALAVRFNVVAWPYIIVSTIARRLGGRKVVRQLLAPLPSIVEGWDALYLELTTGGPHVVVVEKKSGSTVIGIFKSGSATSRHGTYPDLFLAQSCDITKDGRAIPNPDSRGIFIRGSEVATIALWNGSQERVHDGQSTARSMEGGASHDEK